ncbi:MAG: hypothetical protein U0T75_12490 [Chitinophagales bacterium]
MMLLIFIVDKAMEFKLGARGLVTICEAMMNDAMFDLPSGNAKEFVVTREFVEERFEKPT